MAEYNNINKGSIFKNDYKKLETHPDYRGKINVDGADKEISLWVKESKDGKKFFSVSISEPYIKPTVTADVSAPEVFTDDEMGLPF